MRLFKSRNVSFIAASFVVVVSVLVMFGWFAGIDVLKSIVPGFVTMKFSTAIAFFFSGGILFFTSLREKRDFPWADIVLPALTLMLTLLIGTLLLSVLFNFKSGIEDLFVQETSEAFFTTVPGRPSIGTLVSFITIGFLGVISLSEWRRRFKIYFSLGIFIALIGAIALLGYVLGMPLLYYTYEGVSTAMAIHTGTLFLILGLGYYFLVFEQEHKTKLYLKDET